MTGPQTHPKPYAAIFLGLFVLTVLEIIAANLALPRFLVILILLAFAAVKASLVAMFYMHLRFEKILLTLIALVPFLFTAILIIGVASDIVSLK